MSSLLLLLLSLPIDDIAHRAILFSAQLGEGDATSRRLGLLGLLALRLPGALARRSPRLVSVSISRSHLLDSHLGLQ